MAGEIFDPYSYSNYKSLLKDRLQQLRRTRPALSWRSIAERIPMQATYLSKALNDEKAHFSEDDLFRIAGWLELKPDEIDFVLLLRAENSSRERERKEFLARKLGDLRKKRVISADFVETQARDLNEQMAYLLDPVTVLIHVALSITRFKKDPRLLCTLLAISPAKLRKSLETLAKCGYVKLGASPFQIKEVNPVTPHFGREHPLTRVHQIALKSLLMSRLAQTAEEKKESFLVTFSMSEDDFGAAKAAFEEFIKKIRALAKPTEHDRSYRLYQLNFDLLEWF